MESEDGGVLFCGGDGVWNFEVDVVAVAAEHVVTGDVVLFICVSPFTSEDEVKEFRDAVVARWSALATGEVVEALVEVGKADEQLVLTVEAEEGGDEVRISETVEALISLLLSGLGDKGGGKGHWVAVFWFEEDAAGATDARDKIPDATVTV